LDLIGVEVLLERFVDIDAYGGGYRLIQDKEYSRAPDGK